MEELFRRPIKARLNFKAKDQQINNQPTNNRAFHHYLIVSTSSIAIFLDF